MLRVLPITAPNTPTIEPIGQIHCCANSEETGEGFLCEQRSKIVALKWARMSQCGIDLLLCCCSRWVQAWICLFDIIDVPCGLQPRRKLSKSKNSILQTLLELSRVTEALYPLPTENVEWDFSPRPLKTHSREMIILISCARHKISQVIIPGKRKGVSSLSASIEKKKPFSCEISMNKLCSSVFFVWVIRIARIKYFTVTWRGCSTRIGSHSHCCFSLFKLRTQRSA